MDMVFHIALLIVEIVLVVFYVLALVFFLDLLFILGIQLFIGFLIFFYLRYLVLSISKKGLRPRRDLIGYILMLGGPFAGFLNFYLEVFIIYTGFFLWASRAFYELSLWVRLKRLGDDVDEELYDLSIRWEYELMGEDPDSAFETDESDESEIDESDEKKIYDIKDVLLPDEEVKWAARSRTSFGYYCLGFTTIFVVAFIFMSPLPIDSPIALAGYLYCIIVFSMGILNVILYPPWYFITNKRVLKTRGKRVAKEIELDRFGDRPLQEFIAMRVDHYADEHMSSPVYDITIYDPDTSEPLIKFNDIMYGDVWSMETRYFQNMQECKSCGSLFSSNLEYCYVCGESIS